jgi:hypothetical protein
MSYEGYQVFMCPDGHYCAKDVWDPDEPALCGDVVNLVPCGKPLSFVGGVDETNGLPYHMNFYLEEVTPTVFDTCVTCGCSHTVTDAQYVLHRKSWVSHTGQISFKKGDSPHEGGTPIDILDSTGDNGVGDMEEDPQ